MSAGFWRKAQPLLLASGSATRRQMLEHAGIPVEIARPTIDERATERGLTQADRTPERIAAALASAKARDVSQRFPGRLVLGADQTLACDGDLFHKPADRKAAAAQLAALSGQTHRLISAYCLARDGVILRQGAASAELRMRSLSADFIETYLDAAGDAALASVGCYQVEGLGAQLFAGIEGDHFTILGLPLLPLLAALRELDCLAD